MNLESLRFRNLSNYLNFYDYVSERIPKNGKTYSFNAKLSEDGKTLNGRGYIGISALGRSQTWVRIH